MDVLVVGNGGREHVLCWKLQQSALVRHVYCAPGNAGIASVAKCIDIGVDELEKLADFAVEHHIGLTVAGPEAPLCAGIVDVFEKRGLKIFGPDKIAAQLEGSKSFAKDFMLRHNIPTAKAAGFDDAESAIEYIRKEFAAGETGIVVKADGLAAGKGVLVASGAEEAIEFVYSCFAGKFGGAGARVLIEECLIGEEASILALTDGKTIVALASSQDHKRAFDGDLGPNTGGMGSYSPAPVVDDAVMAKVETEILQPFLTGIQQDKLNFKGIIFVGIMVTDKGVKVLEFNVRFGDPEVQSVLSRLDSDLADVMLKTVEGRLSEAELVWSHEPAVCVVMASGGYPGGHQKGCEISGLEAAEADGVKVFHGGTAFKNGRVVNAGGRVLGVCARGENIKSAIERAYAAADKISWDNCFCRRDIGYRAIARLKDNNGG